MSNFGDLSDASLRDGDGRRSRGRSRNRRLGRGSRCRVTHDEGGVAAAVGSVALTVSVPREPRSWTGEDGWVLIVRATKKLLHLAGPSTARDDDRGTTLLGPWYATFLFWRPRIVLLVNETTLLPVLLPLAPAATLNSRIAEEIGTALATHQASATFIDQERQHMQTAQLGVTANRSVVGVMTEFARLAEIHHHDDPALDPGELAVRLAATPCSPLYKRNVSPDRELAAVLQAFTA